MELSACRLLWVSGNGTRHSHSQLNNWGPPCGHAFGTCRSTPLTSIPLKVEEFRVSAFFLRTCTEVSQSDTNIRSPLVFPGCQRYSASSAGVETPPAQCRYHICAQVGIGRIKKVTRLFGTVVANSATEIVCRYDDADRDLTEVEGLKGSLSCSSQSILVLVLVLVLVVGTSWLLPHTEHWNCRSTFRFSLFAWLQCTISSHSVL